MLALLPIVLLAIHPKSNSIPLSAFPFLIFIVTAFILIANIHKKIVVSKSVYIISLWLFFIVIFSLISALVNQTISLRAVVTSLKFLLFFQIFFFSYIVIQNTRYPNTEYAIIKILTILVALQVIIIAITLFNPQAFDIIWSAEKTRGVGQTLRSTGSMYNPNTFGLLMLNFYTILILYFPSNISRQIFLTLNDLRLLYFLNYIL